LGWIPDGLSRTLGVGVLQCPGPNRPGNCPVLQGRECPLVAGADAVVTAIDPDLNGDSLVTCHHRDRPGLRLFVTTHRHAEAELLADDRPAVEAVAHALGLPAIGVPPPGPDPANGAVRRPG